MDTKKLLVFLAGAAVAIFVMKQMEKKKVVVVVPPAPEEAEDPKMTACQAQLVEELKIVRTTDIEGFSTKFLADCMAMPTINGTAGNIPADLPSNQPLDTQLGL